MDWLNYHHLHYFWMVAREGRVASAGALLNRTQPTVTKQIHELESVVGEKLFRREGRRLVLTDTGQTVFRYADDIFTTGRELIETLKGFPAGQPLRLRVGIANVIPKLIAHQLLLPAFEHSDSIRITCREDNHGQLIRDLTTYVLDMILTDTPTGPQLGVQAFNHLLGESGVSFLATRQVVSRLPGKFPRSMDSSRFLLPMDNTGIRRALDQWFERHKIRPRIAGEFEDSALLNTFAQAGMGIVAAPTAIESAITRQYGLRVIGRTRDVRERYYAVTMERKIKHPAVEAVTNLARNLFPGTRLRASPMNSR